MAEASAIWDDSKRELTVNITGEYVTSAPESNLNVTQCVLSMTSAVHGLCSLEVTSPRKCSSSELELSTTYTSLIWFAVFRTRQHLAK